MEFQSLILWADAVFNVYGWKCGLPDCTRQAQDADHIIPRAQGGLNDLLNGFPICRVHHVERTRNQLKYRPEWFTHDQLTYLADHDWVEWEGGEPVGRGWRHFEGWSKRGYWTDRVDRGN